MRLILRVAHSDAFEIKDFSIIPVSSSKGKDFVGRNISVAVLIHPPLKSSGSTGFFKQ